MSILKGHLEHFGLQELLQTLSQGARSGTLEISRGEENVSIVFETGHITLVRSGSSKQLRLRSILLREGMVSGEDLEQAGRDHEETGILLGRALIDRGVIAESEIEKALRKKIEEELFDLFLWTAGSFEFFPEQLKSNYDEDACHVTRVQVDPMSIIIEGLRQADEWTVIRQRIRDHRWILVPEPSKTAPAENHSVFQMINGARTIEEVLAQSRMTRFDTGSVLYRFMEEGFVREETMDEMIRRARDRAAEDPLSALVIYEALLSDHDPESGISLIDEAADCAGHANPEVHAKFLRHAVNALLAAGDKATAWKRLQRLLVLVPGHLEDLQLCWQIRNSLPERKIPLIHEDLCKALRKAGDYRQLITVLREAESIRGKDGVYWLQLGEALIKIKDSGASECLKNAIALSRNESPDIALRAERSLRNLIPELDLDDGTLDELLKRQEEIEKAQLLKRNYKIAAGAFICFLLIMQFSAEWRARGMLSAARQIETNADNISNLITAAEAYERVGQLHPWTFAAGKSNVEGERMRALILNEVVTEKDALHRSREEARLSRQNLRNQVESTLVKAENLINNGAPLKARLLIDQLSQEELESMPPRIIKAIRYPVVLESIPPGATVYGKDRQELGFSPLTLTPKKGEKLEIHLEKSGCQSRVIEVTADSVPRLFVSLVRSPERTFSLPEPAISMAILEELVVTSGRDGKIRLLSRNLLEPLREISVGLEGHPAPALIKGGNNLLALPLSGKPVAISNAGKSLPLGSVHSSPWTCAASTTENGWVLGDADGRVLQFDSKGTLQWSRNFTAPIQFLTCTDGGDVIVVDLMRNYSLIQPDGDSPEKPLSVPGNPICLLKNGDVILTSGKLWSSHGTREIPAPQTAPRQLDDTLLFNTKAGWASLSEEEVHIIEFPVRNTCPPISHSSSNELTWAAGIDCMLRWFNQGGQVGGEVALDTAATDMDYTETGTRLVSLTEGTGGVVKEQE